MKQIAIISTTRRNFQQNNSTGEFLSLFGMTGKKLPLLGKDLEE